MISNSISPQINIALASYDIACSVSNSIQNMQDEPMMKGEMLFTIISDGRGNKFEVIIKIEKICSENIKKDKKIS